MTTADRIFNQLHSLGYQNITVNLWQDTRLYINIKGKPTFYYDIMRSCVIHSEELLPRGFFLSARTLCTFLQTHKEELILELGDGKYRTDKKQAVRAEITKCNTK